MSASQVDEFDETFVSLFRHATPEAAAGAARRLGAEARLCVLRQNWYAPPEGLGDWVAAHGAADEVRALYDSWGLTAHQAGLVVARGDLLADLDSGLVEALGDGRSPLASGEAERQWRATPAGHFPSRTLLSRQALPEVRERVRARLGSDARAWETAFDLLAGGFRGDLPALLDAASRYDSTVADPYRHVDPGTHVSWLARIAPGDLPRRLLARLSPWSLSRAVSGGERARLAPLIVGMDRPALWDEVLGRRDTSYSLAGTDDAEIERVFLRRDDPRLNEWLLTRATGARRRLAPATRLALLEGRPFGPDAEDPLPRTEAVRARIAFPPPEPWDTDLLRLSYDSREPGLVAQALHAAWQGGDTVLTPYQQLVAGIRLWESGRADDLLTPVFRGAEAIRDEEVRTAFTEALRLRSVTPLTTAAQARRERRDEHLDEALRTWRLRLPSSLRPHDLHRLTLSEVAAVGRTVTDDPWYQVDWDLVRARLASPGADGHRRHTHERYGILLARADCPKDVVRDLAGTRLTPLDLLRAHADRDTARAALSAACLPPWTPHHGGALARTVVASATAQPGWEPAVTEEDVLRHARPARGIVRYADPDAVGRVVTEAVERARTVWRGLDEAELWTRLYGIVRYGTVPVPELVRLAAASAATGGEPVDVLPAAEFIVRPEFADRADEVRRRLDLFPARWSRAVRLLAAGFDGPLPALLDAAQEDRHEDRERDRERGREEPSAEAETVLVDHCAPALLLGLAPGAVVETVVARLDQRLCTLLARSTFSADTVVALVRRGSPRLWDALLDGDSVTWPLDGPGAGRSFERRDLREEVLVPALLAQDDPRLNARLVREHFRWSTSTPHIRAVLSGTPFGPREEPVPLLPDLLADFTDWTPESGRELPAWTSNERFWDFPEPVLAFQALMAVRQTNYQDPPSAQLSPRESLTAAATIAAAGRFDLLRYVLDRWQVRYPWGDHLHERSLFEEAVSRRSARPLEAALAELD